MTSRTTQPPASRLARVRAANPKGGPLLGADAELFARQVRAERGQAPAAKSGWALPAILTGPRAVFWGIIIGAIVIGEMRVGLFHMNQNAKQEATNVTCLAITSQPGSGRAPRSTDDEFFRPYRGHNVILRTMDECTPNACPGKAKSDYVRALDDYLISRYSHMNFAHQRFGTDGVEMAQRFHSSNDDHNIVYGARDRLKSGDLDTAELGPARRNFLMLLVRHGNDGVPVCYTSG
jgi:hypothetical protein